MAIDTTQRRKVEYSRESGWKVTNFQNSQYAGWVDFVIEKGQQFTANIAYFDQNTDVIDLSSGYTATWTVKQTSSGTALATLTQAAGITLGAAQPNIVLSVAGGSTSGYAFTRAYHELVLTQTSGTVKTRVLEGSVTLRTSVT